MVHRFPRSQILFGNAGFDALHHTSCTLHSKGAGIPNLEVGNEKQLNGAPFAFGIIQANLSIYFLVLLYPVNVIGI